MTGDQVAVRALAVDHLVPANRSLRPVATQLFRDVMGRFVTGVTVVTVAGTDGPTGTTVNAFTSLSLEPPLILVCLSTGSQTAAELVKAGAFAVNILAQDQHELGRRFASKQRPRGRDSFAQVAHRQGRTGAPLLAGTVGHLDCDLVGEQAAGDHTIFVGAVVAIGAGADVQPLAFHRGRFGQLRLEATA